MARSKAMRTLIHMEKDLLTLLQRIRSRKWDAVMLFVTRLGNGGVIWIAIGILLTIKKKTRYTAMTLLVSLLTGLILGNGLLKNVFMRPRPFMLDDAVDLLIRTPQDWSFPSGHTLSSFEAATAIFQYNRIWGSAAYILAGFIAFSRMYLQVHFPSDVLAGAVLGILIALWVYEALRPEEGS